MSLYKILLLTIQVSNPVRTIFLTLKQTNMITKKLFPNFQLIVGEKSVDLFYWFGVDDLHGLTKKEAEEYPETKDDAY